MSTTATLTPPANRTLADLPMPPGLPWLGQALSLKPMQLAGQLDGWAHDLGTPYRLKLGPRNLVVFDDPQDMQRLLRERPHAVSRSRTIQPVFAEMGINGLFSVEGEAWAPQRRLVMASLNPGHMRGFFPTLQAITLRLHRRWHRAAVQGQVLDMNQELVRYTVDVTSALAFGEDPNTLEQGDNVIQRHLASVFPMAIKRTMAPFRWWHVLKFKADRQLDRDLRAVHAYARQTIARARQRLAEDQPAEPRHALEAMLMMADAPGGGFDDDTIVANVITLLLGGEDTTAHSLAWTMQFLAADPALQARLHQAAATLLGDQVVCPRHDDVKHLDAFEALAMEALRLKPVAPVFGLNLREASHLNGRDGAVNLPRGTDLVFINRPALVSEQHFANPRRYDPSRWDRAQQREQTHGARQEARHDARAFLQFGAGPRVCPGRHLATVEIRLVLSMLLRHFEVTLACDPKEIEEVTAFTMMPSKMPVRLSLRRPNAGPDGMPEMAVMAEAADVAGAAGAACAAAPGAASRAGGCPFHRLVGAR